MIHRQIGYVARADVRVGIRRLDSVISNVAEFKSNMVAPGDEHAVLIVVEDYCARESNTCAAGDLYADQARCLIAIREGEVPRSINLNPVGTSSPALDVAVVAARVDWWLGLQGIGQPESAAPADSCIRYGRALESLNCDSICP